LRARIREAKGAAINPDWKWCLPRNTADCAGHRASHSHVALSTNHIAPVPHRGDPSTADTSCTISITAHLPGCRGPVIFRIGGFWAIWDPRNPSVMYFYLCNLRGVMGRGAYSLSAFLRALAWIWLSADGTLGRRTVMRGFVDFHDAFALLGVRGSGLQGTGYMYTHGLGGISSQRFMLAFSTFATQYLSNQSRLGAKSHMVTECNYESNTRGSMRRSGPPSEQSHSRSVVATPISYLLGPGSTN